MEHSIQKATHVMILVPSRDDRRIAFYLQRKDQNMKPGIWRENLKFLALPPRGGGVSE
jgi:hypothetical protein